MDFPGGSAVKNQPAVKKLKEMWFQTLGWEDPQEKGMTTLQDSCLENSMDRGSWQATVPGVAKSQT